MRKVSQIFMILIYNFLQILLVVLLFPALLAVVLFTAKYRKSIRLRLGFGLPDAAREKPAAKPRIWIHALSVGEVSSARALVRSLRHQYPAGFIIFSASTSSGFAYASEVLADSVDQLVSFPLDFLWSVERFIRRLQPDLFVLIETDIWPNFLSSLARHGVPAILVNGRMSGSSFQKYRRLNFLFAPLFRGFRYIAMQTVADERLLKYFGVAEKRLVRLGNLKYGVLDEFTNPARSASPLSREDLADKRIWVAGSTHSGEEEIIFEVYRRLRISFPDLYLIIAPRNIARGAELAEMAVAADMAPVRRSMKNNLTGDLLILDTLGELASVYRLAEFAFIGGSLVRERGHNPLEPAVFAKGVIFGPHMEDFAEIADDLLSVGGAVQVKNSGDMLSILTKWLTNDESRAKAGRCAAQLVEEQRGVTDRHLNLIRQILETGK